MLQDIIQQPTKGYTVEKEYLFEFDHAALAAVENRTQKSIYEIYDNIVCNKGVRQSEAHALTACAMLKHHTNEEIAEMSANLQKVQGLWEDIKYPVLVSFVKSLFPPQILFKIQNESKKKEPAKTE